MSKWQGSFRVLAGLLWSLGFAALFLAIAIASYFGSRLLGQMSQSWLTPVGMGSIAVAGVLLATWLVRVRINRRAWAGMALPRPRLGQLLFGALCGGFMVLALCGVEYLLGWLHLAPVSSIAGGGRAALASIAIALVPSLGVGFSEELAFRGYVYQTLAERMPVGFAAAVTGVIFGLVHFTVNGFGAMYVLSILLISTMFLAMRLVTGSLWFPIGFHALYDWTQTYLVGLSTTGQSHDPSLIHVVQTGPTLWVGRGQAIESGLLFMAAAIVVTLFVLACGKRARGRSGRSSIRE